MSTTMFAAQSASDALAARAAVDNAAAAAVLAAKAKAKADAKASKDKPRKPAAIGLADFVQHAVDLPVAIGDDSTLEAGVKLFATKSYGWYGNGKITVVINGVAVPCQVGLNITVIGSKPE